MAVSPGGAPVALVPTLPLLTSSASTADWPRGQGTTTTPTATGSVFSFSAAATAAVAVAAQGTRPVRRRSRRSIVQRARRLRRSALGGGEVDQEANPVALVLRSQLAELAKRGEGPGDGRWEDLAGARVILPADTIPWGVVHFVGGAVLGTFPELCYDALLRPLADRAGLAVVCTPYELGRDHEALSRQMSAAFETAVAAGAVRYGWQPVRMPRLLLGHSLGAKLQVLARCRPPAVQAPVLGTCLLAFNNFGVEDQVQLLRDTVRTIRGAAGGGFPGEDQFWDMLQPAIGRVAKMNGMEFTPSPEELLDIVQEQYDASGRTRAFRFAEDPLDCSSELLEVLSARSKADCSIMAGGHLAPVFISLQSLAERAAAKAPPGMAGRVAEQVGGFAGGRALGNEAELEVLIEGIVSWIRRPA